MKCPLNNQYERDEHGDTTPVFGDCLKEECAWWDKKFDGCSISELNRTLYLVQAYLEDIRKKMPKDLAPGR